MIIYDQSHSESYAFNIFRKLFFKLLMCFSMTIEHELLLDSKDMELDN